MNFDQAWDKYQKRIEEIDCYLAKPNHPMDILKSLMLFSFLSVVITYFLIH